MAELSVEYNSKINKEAQIYKTQIKDLETKLQENNSNFSVEMDKILGKQEQKYVEENNQNIKIFETQR